MSTDIEGRVSGIDAAALTDFCRRVRAALGDGLVELRLFGSKARGDAGPDADIDVLVVIDAPGGRWPLAGTVSDVAFDVNLEHDVFISPIVVTTSMLSEEGWRRSPLMRAVRAEGVRL